jgi:hypothetical protein
LFAIDLATLTVTRKFGISDWVREVLAMPDGRTLAMPSVFSDHVTLVDTVDGTVTDVPVPDPTDIEVVDVKSCGFGCVGDCDGDGRVSIAELLRGVMEMRSAGEDCAALDIDGDDLASIDELVRAVKRSPRGCG